MMITIIIILIIVIVIMITINTSAFRRKEDEIETTSQKEVVSAEKDKKKLTQNTTKSIVVTILSWVALITLLLIAIWAILGVVGTIKEIFYSPQPTTSRNLQNPSSLRNEGRIKEKSFHSYSFSHYSGGRVRVYLSCSGGVWKDFPKGGRIALETESGRLIGYDEPGIKKSWGFIPDGWYVFRPADAEATGVEIFH